MAGGNGPFSHLWFGPSLGIIDGTGLEVAAPITSHLTIRAGYSMLPKVYTYSEDFHIPKINSTLPEADTRLEAWPSARAANLILDIYPSSSNNFHFSAGVFYCGKSIATATNTIPLPSQYSTTGLTVYKDDSPASADMYVVKADANGYATLDLRAKNRLMPYLAIGVGQPDPDRIFSMLVDVGVMYSGGLGFYAEGTNILGNTEDVRLTSNTIGKNKNGTFHDHGWLDKLNNDTIFKFIPSARLTFLFKLF